MKANLRWRNQAIGPADRSNRSICGRASGGTRNWVSSSRRVRLFPMAGIKNLAKASKGHYGGAMALNIIKLGVGVPDVEWLEARAAKGGHLVVHTRMTPKRAAEIEDGGSLYWVVKGVIVCRQRVLDIATLGEGKESRCEITLEPRVIRTTPMARRPFQGWRYFEAKDAPADMTELDAGEAPEELVRQLRELGAW